MRDVRRLRVFQAVMATGATTQAAARLGLSQPSVSGALKALERETRLRLFLRQKGRLEPTPEAYAFLAEIEPLLRGLDDLDRVTREIRQVGRSSISVFSYPGAAWSFMPSAIAEARALDPTFSAKLVSRSSETVRLMLRAKRFHVALIEAPAPDFGVPQETFTFRCDVALPAGHRLAARRALAIEDLFDEQWAVLFGGHGTAQHLHHLFEAAPNDPKIVFEADFFVTAAQFVRANGGVTLIDPITAERGPPHGLVIRPLTTKITYSVVLLQNPGEADPPAADAFAELLRTKLRALADG